jgi:hypothetical protein
MQDSNRHSLSFTDASDPRVGEAQTRCASGVRLLAGNGGVSLPPPFRKPFAADSNGPALGWASAGPSLWEGPHRP